MNKEDAYEEINRKLWNKRTDFHVKSDFYQVDDFLKGASSLNEIELGLLGDIRGKKVLHLQCHFGQDTLSLARLGADVTGVDLSDHAITEATALAEKAGLNSRFICCNVYDLRDHLDEKFDIIFSSYGTIGWLPDLDKWAGIISSFLKPAGRFVFAEFHPVVWMFDNDFSKVAYNYFKDKAIVETESNTYADLAADINLESVSWNHSLAEVISSLLAKDLQLVTFNEYDYSPYNCFKHTIEIAPDKFRIMHLENKIPMVFALVAVKK